MKTIQEVLAEGQAIQAVGDKLVADIQTISGSISALITEGQDVMARSAQLNADVKEIADTVTAPPSDVPPAPTEDPIVEVDLVTQSGTKASFIPKQ